MTNPHIEQHIQRHEAFLQEIINNTNIAADRLRCATQYMLFPGGKRIRPILAYLAAELLDVDMKITDVIAAAIELTHCYSLIHDDLPAMDNDDLRRGKPSCHKAYDEATAILVGDGLQAMAIELLLQSLPSLVDAPCVISITHELLKASGMNGMVSGQSLDLSELSKEGLSEARLAKVHQLKTGKLITACFEMIIAAKPNADYSIKTALRAYADHIGLVFQIQDDYLDCYAPKAVLGKNHSSDLANQKTTYATLFTQSQLEEKIALHYELATAALKPCGIKAGHLKELTRQLKTRSDVNKN